MTADLDTTLRGAAGALRDSVAPNSAGPPPRPSSAPILTATALVVVAAILAAAVAFWPNNDKDTTVPSSDVSTKGHVVVPRLIPDHVPDGYVVSGASDPSEMVGEAAATGPVSRTVLYGDSGADDPFAHSDLQTSTTRWPEDTNFDGGSGMPPEGHGHEVTVRGHTGVACAPDECIGEVMATLYWPEEEPLFDVRLTSRSLDIDQLQQVAEDLTFEGDYAVVGSPPSDVDGPLDELARSQPNDLPLVATGYSINYAPPHNIPGGPTLQVSTGEGGESNLLMTRWLAGEWRRVEVRGHEGSISVKEERAGGGPDRQTAITLLWEEEPGVIAQVTTLMSPLTEDEVLQVAESLRPATDEEWAAALQVDDPPDPANYGQYIPTDVVASVNTTGMGSAAYLTADGQLCGYVVDSEGKLPDVCGSADDRVLVLADRGGNVHTYFGRVPEGTDSVAGVSPEYPDSHPMMYAFLDRQDEPPEVPHQLYAWVPAGGPLPTELQFLADGVVLEAVPVP
ncbi:MAG TPA: hypothetical protein VGJ86_23750 [Acidimicrobiales bacterium]